MPKKEKEFAPGIPAGRVIKPIPKIVGPEEWKLTVQKHDADKAGIHYDVRLNDPATGHAHSWALRHLPKPGEMMLATAQPTHLASYSTFSGDIKSGYGKGKVELIRKEKAEVLKSDDKTIRFNLYPGQNTEEYALRKWGDNWLLHNVTTTRQSTAGQKLPNSKPNYKVKSPGDIDINDPSTELQAKIDGSHISILFKQPGQTPRLLSYRPTERETGVIEHTHKLPGFASLGTPTGLKDTILRGELYAVDKDGRALPAARVGGILNAGVWKSRQKQKEEGHLVPVAFDVVRWKGKDVEKEPYSVKKKFLETVHDLAPWLHKPRTATTPEEKQKLMDDISSGKEPSTQEGVVEWHKDKALPIKAKFLDEKNVYVRDIFAEAGAKRQGTMAGGFSYSLTPKGKVIGKTGTGFSHVMKKDMLENPNKYIGLKARIKVQKAPANYAPRAPSFISFDLDQEMPEGIKTAGEDALFAATHIGLPAALALGGVVTQRMLAKSLDKKRTIQGAKLVKGLEADANVSILRSSKLEAAESGYASPSDLKKLKASKESLDYYGIDIPRGTRKAIIVGAHPDPAVLAHELGHASREGKLVPKMRGASTIGMGAAAFAPTLLARAPKTLRYGAYALPTLAYLPTLYDEFAASRTGLKLLKARGASPKELSDAKTRLTKAFATYAITPAIITAGGHSLKGVWSGGPAGRGLIGIEAKAVQRMGSNPTARATKINEALQAVRNAGSTKTAFLNTIKDLGSIQ